MAMEPCGHCWHDFLLVEIFDHCMARTWCIFDNQKVSKVYALMGIRTYDPWIWQQATTVHALMGIRTYDSQIWQEATTVNFLMGIQDKTKILSWYNQGNAKILCRYCPNLGFLSQIRSNLDQTFRIGPLATTNIIFDVQLDQILHVQSDTINIHQDPL